MPVHISIVIPVYGCKTALIELYFRLKESLSKISEDFEILMINDASPDGAWETIIELSTKDNRVKGIDLSRNFGQHYAITAGLDHALGEWVVIMDCDLQDQPEEIIKLYNKAKEGFDIVYGRRLNRNDSWFKKKTSKLFFKMFAYFTNSKMNNSVANFCISNQKVVKQITKMREHYRSYLLFLRWAGFNSTEIDIEHAKRTYGKSSYSLSKLISLAFRTIISFSDKPLLLTIKLGLIITMTSFLFVMILVINNLLYGTNVIGWSSLIASIFFSMGIIITVLGIIGIYIGRIFEEVKNRPLYIIKDTTFKN